MPSKVPERWPVARLSQVAELSLGKMLDKDKNRGEMRPYLANINVRWGSFDLQELREMRFEERETERYCLRPGDIVMCEGGEPGRCALWLEDEIEMMIQKALHRIRPMDEIDSHYLYFALAQKASSGAFSEYLTGGGIKHLPGEKLAKVELPIPPLDEQRRIAEVLRSVANVIACLQKSCNAYDRVRIAEVESFAQNSVESGPQALESLIAGMDSGWSPDCDGERAAADEWGVLKTSAVVWEGFDDRHNKRLPADLSPRPELAVARDDILITRAGPAERTGVVAIVKSTDGKRMLSDKLIRVRAKKDIIEPVVLAELLRSKVVQDQFRALKSGMAASQTNISQKALRGVLVPNASQQAQRVFVERMANLDAALDAERQVLLTMTTLQKSIAAELLTGRVRVPA